ncbi:hypothetical protein [Actinokineospora globicatena]|uniref:hypothetical protein n=1 Tax=Actinokineospora globicatena TaxID=103729 RepID=UPI0020A4E81F|nr:hypothetical protein [Actinokineospora globicatena]MCP2304267.1 hypothetical protein [Actinokineospora globicatena]GLW78371.1 hypothetical protein Aglo01_28530 [Actinokineospora globicatena]GLW84964.1 hypothetical protein Aglo02_26040 [Actinokineospora globicatena]
MRAPATPEITELATFLHTTTAPATTRDLADRFGGARALWGEYHRGARIVPWHLLERVVTESVADRRARVLTLARAKQLYDSAEASAARVELLGCPAATPSGRRGLAVALLATAVVSITALANRGAVRRVLGGDREDLG